MPDALHAAADASRSSEDPCVPRPEDVRLHDIADGRERELLLAAVAGVTDPDRHEGAWDVRPLGGGASNMNYLIQRPGGRYVLRVPDRDQARFGGTADRGCDVQSAAAAAGVAPRVDAYRSPDGVCLVRFIDGQPLSSDDVRSADALEPIGRLLRTLHDGPAIDVSWSAFTDLDHYVGIARAERLALPPDIDDLHAAAHRVEAAFADVEGATGLCHNDLQPQNFILADDRLWLIDWEYAGVGNRYFDLGAFAVNVELTPAEVERLLVAYFGPEARLDVLRARVNLMRMVSAIREAVWAVIAEPVLANDWDYKAWADEFFARARATAGSPTFDALVARASQGA